MSNHLISAYYFPTTIIIIDDNETFLEQITLGFEDNPLILTFSDPEKALAYFETEYALPLSNTQSLYREESDLHTQSQYQFNLDLMNSSKCVCAPSRFKEVSVVLVDYYMAKRNGLELCEQLKKFPFKKVLITAQAGKEVAVDGFNTGIIQQFILKSDPDFFERVEATIKQFQKMYFHDLSKHIIEPLMRDRLCVLSQPAFQEFFFNLCKENGIVEYYLMDPSGSMLLLDKRGKSSWLLVKHEDDFEAFIDIAVDSGADSALIDALYARQVLPFFPTQKDISQVEGDSWEKYTYHSEPIPGISAFHYAYVKDRPVFSMNMEQIFSYDDYLRMEDTVG